MSFLFIKYLAICHEEPLRIIHFYFLYSILCPSISILSHSILTLHHSCTSKSSPSLHLLHPSMKRCLAAATQEPTTGRKDMLLFIHKKEQPKKHSTLHMHEPTNYWKKKVGKKRCSAATQIPTVRRNQAVDTYATETIGRNEQVVHKNLQHMQLLQKPMLPYKIEYIHRYEFIHILKGCYECIPS